LSHWVLNLFFLVCFLEASVQKMSTFLSSLLWLNFHSFTSQILFQNSSKKITEFPDTPKIATKKNIKKFVIRNYSREFYFHFFFAEAFLNDW
jgi:hypothetical protein